MLNKEVEDEYFLKDAKPYIYWRDKYWFIVHWTTHEKAEDACPARLSSSKILHCTPKTIRRNRNVRIQNTLRIKRGLSHIVKE